MKNFFLRTFFLLLLTTVTFTLHTFFIYALPFPWNTINVIFIILFLYFLWTESGTVVWLAFIIHLLIELYPIQSFGVILLPATLSFLTGFWLYRVFFTNKSLLSTIFLMMYLLLSYRFFYTLSFIFTKQSFAFSWNSLLLIYFWEFLLTVGITTILFLLITHFSRRLKTGTL